MRDVIRPDLEAALDQVVDPTPWRELWLATKEEQIRRAWASWAPKFECLDNTAVKIWLCVRQDVVNVGRTPLEALKADRKDLIRCYAYSQTEEAKGEWHSVDLETFLDQQDRDRPPILLELRGPPTLHGFDAVQEIRKTFDEGW